MGCEHNSVLQKLGCLHDLILQSWLAHHCCWVLHYWILLRIACQWESVLQRNLVCLLDSVLKTTVCVHNSVLQRSVICQQGWVLQMTVVPAGTSYLRIPSWGGSTGPGPVPASSPTLWASLHCCGWSSQWRWHHPLHLPPPPPFSPPLQQGMTIKPPYTYVLQNRNISFMARHCEFICCADCMSVDCSRWGESCDGPDLEGLVITELCVQQWPQDLPIGSVHMKRQPGNRRSTVPAPKTVVYPFQKLLTDWR